MLRLQETFKLCYLTSCGFQIKYRHLLEPTCKYKRHNVILDTKLGAGKDHGKNHAKVRPLLIHHLHILIVYYYSDRCLSEAGHF